MMSSVLSPSLADDARSTRDVLETTRVLTSPDGYNGHLTLPWIQKRILIYVLFNRASKRSVSAGPHDKTEASPLMWPLPTAFCNAVRLGPAAFEEIG
jgi:hypothetical protein